MATITSSGLGSGLDVNGIITKLMAVEQAPLNKLNSKEASYQSRISALGSLQSSVSALNASIASLTPSSSQTAASKYISYKASVTDSSIASASAVSTSTPGSYSLEVTQLATNHRISTLTQAHKLATPATVDKGLSSGELNISLQGSGYFQVKLPDDSLAYTRAGNFTVDAGGQVLTQEGYVVQTGFTIPSGTQSLSISSTGEVTARDGAMATTSLGTIQLAQFTDAGTLTDLTNGYYAESGTSGSATLAAPGSGGNGLFNTGYTSSTDKVPQGTLAIQIGSGTAVNVTIDSTNDTLAGLKAAINAADAGVTAEIAADAGGGFRLVLSSNTTGANGKISMSGLAGFDFNATTSAGTLSENSALGGQVAMGGYANADATIPTGTLSISLGSGATKNLVIDSTNNTLAGLRDAINGAGLGISAAFTSVATNDVRITLSSSTSGAAGKITLSGIPGFEFNPNSTSGNTLSDASSDGGQTAQGSLIKLNGITLARDSNTITDAIQGVTLNLSAKTTTATTLTISHDKSTSLSNSLNSLVKSYNELNKAMRDLGSYNADTKQGGVLLGDATLRTVSNSIRAAIQTPYLSTGSYRRLSDLGVAMQKDGSLTFDASKLASASAADYTSVATLVAAFGNAAKTLTASMISDKGTITAATNGAKSSIKELDKRRTELGQRLTQIEARYRKQFTSLDSLVASMNQTSSYLTRQLANLPGGSSSN